jgi:23S rRNA U2552 (ribose-2'-O)-methylase RlmE/FtsJ
MTRRMQSSRRWLAECFSGPYVRRAQAEGRRFRAVFRLEQAGKKEQLLRRGQVAPDMAGKVLKPGGGALIKAFQGAGFQELAAAARRQFKGLRFLKPAAARARSAAICLLASGLRLV